MLGPRCVKHSNSPTAAACVASPPRPSRTAAAGARPRRVALSGIDALTPAEHRVVTLAAQGRSNREIAQQLYVTRRTVETHLTHAFQKLRITARAELPAHLDHAPNDEPARSAPAGDARRSDRSLAGP